MRQLIALPATFALAVAIVGCQMKPKPKPMPPMMPTDAAYMQIKDDFAKSSPDAKVGYVDEALPDEPWVSISKVNVADFPMNAPVNLIDGEKNILAQGNVAKVVDDKVYVKYVKTGSRMPMAGDVAVRF